MTTIVSEHNGIKTALDVHDDAVITVNGGRVYAPDPTPTEPAETGLNENGKPKLWSWWRGVGEDSFAVISNSDSKLIMAMYPDDELSKIGTNFSAFNFLGISQPGCDLDGKPLKGGVWESDIDGRCEHTITGWCNGTDRPTSKCNRHHDNWHNLLLKNYHPGGTYKFLRMSQLDELDAPTEPEKPKPLSETIAVGDVVCITGDKRNCEVLGIDRDRDAVALRDTVNARIFMVTLYAMDINYTFVSRAADNPIEERFRLGDTLRFPDGHTAKIAPAELEKPNTEPEAVTLLRTELAKRNADIAIDRLKRTGLAR